MAALDTIGSFVLIGTWNGDYWVDALRIKYDRHCQNPQ